MSGSHPRLSPHALHFSISPSEHPNSRSRSAEEEPKLLLPLHELGDSPAFPPLIPRIARIAISTLSSHYFFIRKGIIEARVGN